ncbi:hypothetical protein [Streptomyces broussonetiae]|uniref:hypothetical protein n=1 Tax=Streptomyces broussonetiae TaxID=2686304 RepID=UPI0018EF0335|nr:hypothetical protein [Streptomyces broussonetiae]
MPEIMQLSDLDALIGDLETRITESTLPSAEADTGGCSGVCTVIVCDTVVVCSGVVC